MVAEGERQQPGWQLAPELNIPDANGETVTLAALRGKKVVVYFYPRDDTPGCTVEACGFRDQDAAIAAAGAVVLGISPDDAKSHGKFAAKFGLPFRLLCDPDHRVAEAWGAWGEKSMYGKKYMGILRSTFLVDEEGRIARAWPKVKVEGHADEVLAAIRGEAPSSVAARSRASSAKKNEKAAPSSVAARSRASSAKKNEKAAPSSVAARSRASSTGKEARKRAATKKKSAAAKKKKKKKR